MAWYLKPSLERQATDVRTRPVLLSADGPGSKWEAVKEEEYSNNPEGAMLSLYTLYVFSAEWGLAPILTAN